MKNLGALACLEIGVKWFKFFFCFFKLVLTFFFGWFTRIIQLDSYLLGMEKEMVATEKGVCGR